MIDLPADIQVGQDVTCGYVSVPKEHGNPEGAKIKLAVMIIKSKADDPKSDSLFLAQGGPGGSTIETYAEILLDDNPLTKDRDIILWDQRGTKYSQPSLYCIEDEQLIAETIEKDLPDEEAEKLDLESITSCRDRLEKDRINLSAYDSLENAADIEEIRKSLGYEQINLYGVSYGTLLAQHYMQNYPGSLRSVILDAVVPTDVNFNLNSPKTMSRSFNELFQACARDPYCNSSFPDLETTFYKVVDRLNSNPVRLELRDTEKQKTYPQAVIDGDTFIGGLFQMLYAGSLIPALPRMIDDASKGNFDFFKRIYSILVFDRSISSGMYYSVFCAEDSDFALSDQDLSGLPPQISAFNAKDAELTLEACKIWGVQPLGSEVDLPVKSSIPTLILSGKFDPITPPTYGENVAKSLSQSFSIEFPTGGHGQMLEGECENGIINAFLENPRQKPDSSCLNDQKAVNFITSRTVIDLPIILPLLNLENGTALQAGSLFAALFVLSTSIFLIPLSWIINQLRRKRQKTTLSTIPIDLALIEEKKKVEEVSASSRAFFDRAAGWLAVLAAIILGVFIFGFVVVLYQMINANDNRLFFGISTEARPLIFLALVYVFASIVILAAAVMSWIKRYWSIWMRLYYTVLTLSALYAVFILTRWGIIEAAL